jgi:uncharacterized alpha-E superfamily protein
VISRVADSCFWITRYIERVDTLARLLEVHNTFQLDVPLPNAERWRPLVIVSGVEEDFLERVGEEAIDDPEAVQEYLTWDPDHPSSILASLRWARENARTVREVLSVEMWESINDTWLWINGRSARRLYNKERDDFYGHLSSQCMLFHGICYSTMLHEEPWVFMKLGRAVERAGQTARVLDVKHHSLGTKPREEETAADAAQWLAILRSCLASDAFFKKADNVLGGPAVLGFLLFERTFPHSVLHNLDRTRGLMTRLFEGDPPGMRRASWDLLERFRGTLYQMTPKDVQRQGIHEILTWIVDQTGELCTAIHHDYLDPSVDQLRASARSMQSVASASQSQGQGQQRQASSS